MRSGRRMPEKYVVRITAERQHRDQRLSNVFIAKSMAMKLIAMPASVESSAARGVDAPHLVGDRRAGELDQRRTESTRRGRRATRIAPRPPRSRRR